MSFIIKMIKGHQVFTNNNCINFLFIMFLNYKSWDTIIEKHRKNAYI